MAVMERPTTARKPRHRPAELDDPAWLAERLAQRLSLKQIAEEIGTNPTNVHRALGRHGLKAAGPGKRISPFSRVLLEDREWMQERRQEGVSAEAVAKRLGVSSSTVSDWWHHHGILSRREERQQRREAGARLRAELRAQRPDLVEAERQRREQVDAEMAAWRREQAERELAERKVALPGQRRCDSCGTPLWEFMNRRVTTCRSCREQRKPELRPKQIRAEPEPLLERACGSCGKPMSRGDKPGFYRRCRWCRSTDVTNVRAAESANLAAAMVDRLRALRDEGHDFEAAWSVAFSDVLKLASNTRDQGSWAGALRGTEDEWRSCFDRTGEARKFGPAILELLRDDHRITVRGGAHV